LQGLHPWGSCNRPCRSSCSKRSSTGIDLCFLRDSADGVAADAETVLSELASARRAQTPKPVEPQIPRTTSVRPSDAPALAGADVEDDGFEMAEEANLGDAGNPQQ